MLLAVPPSRCNLCTSDAPFSPVDDMAQASGGMTDVERIAHYFKLAAQFREWAETETNEEARSGLLDMARQYDRLVKDGRLRPREQPSE